MQLAVKLLLKFWWTESVSKCIIFLSLLAKCVSENCSPLYEQNLTKEVLSKRVSLEQTKCNFCYSARLIDP